MDDTINRVIELIKKNRKNVLDGGINCIPSPFTGFRHDFVGTQQKKYYLISAQQKAGKTQLTSYIFIFNNLLYAYHHPDQVRIKIFYYSLEEPKEDVVMRFMSYLLYTISNHNTRISPEDLQSVNEKNIVPQEVIDTLETKEYKDILDFFNDHVIFEESTNPTGVWKDLNNYADSHGKTHYKDREFVDRETGEIKKKRVFDYYEPDDPGEYVEIIWDHISLTSLERGMNLRQSIEKLSEYFVSLRNKFGYIPVVIQQQTDETQNLEAFKQKKIRPSATGLADSRRPGKDCNIMIGIIDPFSFEIPSYKGYNITKFGDHIRFIEMILNRGGQKNGILPVYFDGATCFYSEICGPKDVHTLESYYNFIARLDRKKVSVSMFGFMRPFINKIKKQKK